MIKLYWYVCDSHVGSNPTMPGILNDDVVAESENLLLVKQKPLVVTSTKDMGYFEVETLVMQVRYLPREP